MLMGLLSAQTLRRNYLRGIDLGTAWQGGAADPSLEQLLLQQLSLAEWQMNVVFRTWRIKTGPDASEVLGQTYDVPGQYLPYVPPPEDAVDYALQLAYHDVRSVDRVRLFQGYDMSVPPAPIYDTLPLTTITYTMPDERLHVPLGLVADTTRRQAWAIDYTVGMGLVPPEVAEWVYLGVAIQVLAIAGSGTDVSHGLDASTLRMDNIEETQRYSSGGMGIYAGTIKVLQLQRDEIELPRLRFRYQNSRIPNGLPA